MEIYRIRPRSFAISTIGGSEYFLTEEITMKIHSSIIMKYLKKIIELGEFTFDEIKKSLSLEDNFDELQKLLHMLTTMGALQKSEKTNELFFSSFFYYNWNESTNFQLINKNKYSINILNIGNYNLDLIKSLSRLCLSSTEASWALGYYYRDSFFLKTISSLNSQCFMCTHLLNDFDEEVASFYENSVTLKKKDDFIKSFIDQYFGAGVALSHHIFSKTLVFNLSDMILHKIDNIKFRRCDTCGR